MLCTVSPCATVKEYLEDQNISIKSKTYNGWIRVFLSREKRKRYNFRLSKDDVTLYIDELKTLQHEKIEGKIR